MSKAIKDIMRILIVGAGISGLAMALALEKEGFAPLIIEKHPSLKETGAGIALPMNAVEVLFKFGLKDALMQVAHTVKNITYALPDGEVLSNASLIDNAFNRFPFVALHRKDLLNLLAEAISTPIKFNTTIVNLEIDPDSRPVTQVTFNNGEIASFDLIIAADGLNSQLRKNISETSVKDDIGVTTWRFIAKFRQDNPVYYFGKMSAFMIYPINDSEVYCYGHVLNKSKINLAHKEHLSRVFGEYPSKVNWLIQSVRQENIITGRLESVRPLFKVGNIAFIGDAAHACSPMLQQGAAKGLEDALALSQMLYHFQNVNDALIHYEEFRKPRVEWINHHSDLPLKNLTSSITDEAYENRNQLIRKNGPINVEKWKILFKENYIDLLQNYLIQINYSNRRFVSKL